MKTFLGILPLLFALALCFGTTSCKSVVGGEGGLGSLFGNPAPKKPTGPGNYGKSGVKVGPGGSSLAKTATISGTNDDDKRGQGGPRPVEPTSGGRGELIETKEGIHYIATGDEVIVDLLGIPEADRYEFRLAADGNISLPLIGSVMAKGKTSEQLKNDIIGLHVPDYYRTISVNVIIASKPYYIHGNVKDPGPKRMEGRTTFVQAIAAAGGVDEYAHKNNVFVKRRGNQYKVDRELIDQNPELDFEIFAGDVITVDEAWY